MSNSIKLNATYPDIQRSQDMLKMARRIMHPVSQTLAKAPGQFSEGVCPVFVERAKGNRIWDVDGNKYLDYYAAIGPISLGYCYDAVDDAIREQLSKGITFSLMHRLEYELCELIHQIIPNAESIRISKTGADVCSAAVRVARAYTRRDKVLCCGYHGWHDWYIATTSRDHGIPEAVKSMSQTFKYNDLEDLSSKIDNHTAAVIMEPVVFEYCQPGYLEGVQALCKKHGALLIFDEMWTGFRLAIGGAQEYFNVVPDLAVYSKAVANGMPIALLTGRNDVMQLFERGSLFLHHVWRRNPFTGSSHCYDSRAEIQKCSGVPEKHRSDAQGWIKRADCISSTDRILVMCWISLSHHPQHDTQGRQAPELLCLYTTGAVALWNSVEQIPQHDLCFQRSGCRLYP
jgi:glutamate-1-semialdehyde 2,1-aminomutase